MTCKAPSGAGPGTPSTRRGCAVSDRGWVDAGVAAPRVGRCFVPTGPLGNRGRTGFEGSPSGAAVDPCHRPSLNHRCIVRMDGGRAPCFSAARMTSSMTARGASPAAKRRSMCARSSGQAYEPTGGASRRRTLRSRADSASSRCRVRHPAAAQTWRRLTTMSRPDRPVRKSSLRCSAQSHTLTPCGRSTLTRRPFPGPEQIAHAGVFPSRSPL